MVRRVVASERENFAYLYVLGIPGGPYKIGYSYSPEDRVRAMIRAGHKGAFLCGQWPMETRVVQAAERYVHWLLRDRRLKNEWFNVTRGEAEDAVRKALEPEALNALDVIPSGTLPDKRSGYGEGDYVRTKFAVGTRERIRAALRPGEYPADLHRAAVEAELRRRERDKSKT